MRVISEGSSKTLQELGLINLGKVFWNAPTPLLYEEAVKGHEGIVAHLGSLVVRTGSHTGRSPNDRFIVKDSISANKINCSMSALTSLAKHLMHGKFACITPEFGKTAADPPRSNNCHSLPSH